MIRIKGESSPEVAAVLDLLSREAKRNSERNGKRAQRGGAQDNEIETAIIQALAPLQNTLHFEGLISKTNDYNQTLAHFAVLFGYINLLRLVEWNIDLTIADVNGLTALHCAYKKGDRACVELLLNMGRWRQY
jgi:ankyrin repeat protein